MSLEKQLNNANYDECKTVLNYKYEYDKSFPLCLACENNNYDIVELLIKVKIPVRQRW